MNRQNRRQQTLYLLAVGTLLVTGLVQAQETEAPGGILIQNATLLDPAGTAPDRMVNLLVRNGKLEVVSEDSIPAEDGDEVLNAAAGYIVGNLKIDEAPNFMLLIADPREDFQALLDTKTYASFAMHDGRIIKNELILEPELAALPKDRQQESNWLAYTPPPLALPIPLMTA